MDYIAELEADVVGRKQELQVARASSSVAASSQHGAVIGIGNFQLESDEPAWRFTKGFMRCFGIATFGGTQDGENILHKLCGLASPPWNNLNTIPAVRQVLTSLAEMDLHIDAECTVESKSAGRRAMDLICNNKSPNGAKPEILKLLLEHRASIEQANVQPPIFAAAGTANLECCKLLVAARADLQSKYKGTTLVIIL